MSKLTKIRRAITKNPEEYVYDWRSIYFNRHTKEVRPSISGGYHKFKDSVLRDLGYHFNTSKRRWVKD